VADPEQLYQEVLEEERAKGSSGQVAEGRAKAARVRAEQGSPHPKEPKWWPGAQPHLEEGGAEAPAQEAPPEEAPAVAEPETPAVATEAPPAPAPAPDAEGPEPAAPAEAPAPAEAAAPAAAAPAADAAGPEPAPQVAAAPAEAARPPGVLHGTTTGTRLRPEDQVTTEAQFEGQQAMYRRRKMIDELVTTEGSAITTTETGGRGGFWLALLYLAIPLAVIFLLAAQEDEGGGGGGSSAPPATSADVTLVAQNVQWDTDSITLPSGGATVALDNKDSVEHDFGIYETEADADAQQNAIVDTPNVSGGDSGEFEAEVPKPGEYVFQCNIHPSMRGTATVE